MKKALRGLGYFVLAAIVLAGALATATAMIKTHRHRLDKLSQALVERETLEAPDLDVVLGPRELPPDVVPVQFDPSVAGDETGGVIAGLQHHLVVARRAVGRGRRTGRRAARRSGREAAGEGRGG